jgi:parallel beta-helix repeat protein
VNRFRTYRAVGSVVLLATLAAALAPAPVSASGTTRWVDDDGKAGPSSCSGSATAKTRIQKAINASGANDTIKVCPGTYTEKPSISGARDGLTLTSVTSHAAIIKAKDVATYDTIVLVQVTDVDNVTIKGFSIRPLRADSSGYCDIGDGIDVSGSKNVSIKGNEIRPAGNGPFCGVFSGVSATAGTTGTIKHNVITDYHENGIHLGGNGTNMTVSKNTVTFAQVGLDPAGGAAIRVDTGAKGSITGNTITGPATGGTAPQPAAGVELNSSASGTNITDNTIARMAADIKVNGASGGTISGNTMTGGQAGLDLLDGDDMTVTDNTSAKATVSGFAIGNGSTGDNVHDNDFRTNKNGNLLFDCKGESSLVVSVGSGNTFDANLGDTSKPAALCTDRVPR